MAKGQLNGIELLIMAGSAGSLEIIIALLGALGAKRQLTIVVVVHRKHSDSILTDLLAEKTKWPVKEAEEKEPILPGRVYLAPADYHLLFEKDRTFSLDFSEKVHYSRPSIDVSFETAADAYGPALACLLLSGANADGAEGLSKVKEAGGLCLVQQPSEALVSYMPKSALDRNAHTHVFGLAEMTGLMKEC